MPAPMRLNLTDEEDKHLKDISLAAGIPRRTKLRAMAVRLNAGGWTVAKIAQHLHPFRSTPSAGGFGAGKRILVEGLGEVPRPGRQPDDLQAGESWLAEPRSYTSQQLCQRLASERQVELSKRQLSRLLQKRGTAGNDYATVLQLLKT